MDKIKNIKAFFVGFFGILSSYLGVLAVPVYLMVSCNIIDYISGLTATPFRNQDINSYRSIRGIMKKVAMWLLVVVGAIIDKLILYTTQTFNIKVPFNWMIACIVAIWIVCNELISILENLKDMGIALPKFLQPLVKNIKSQVENLAEGDEFDENQ